MDETKKMINWVAGISTAIVVLLIFIVLLEPRTGGISRAMASRTVALTLAKKEEVEASAAEMSFFSEELQEEWYVKYMDFLYGLGYLDPEACPPEEATALSAITYGELAGWAAAALESRTGAEEPEAGADAADGADPAAGADTANEPDSSAGADAADGADPAAGADTAAGQDTDAAENAAVRETLAEFAAVTGRKKEQTAGRDDFWKFYAAFRQLMDPEGRVTELTTDLYGTPGNVDGSAPWTAYTKDGKFLFEGLALDPYIDRTVRFLISGSSILRVEEVVSGEIVYENAWISGYSGGQVTVFIGNIQREFPVRGVLRNEDEISGQIGDLYLKNGKPTRLVLKTERITGTVLAVREDEIEIEGYGAVPLAENFKIYRTYGVLREQQKKDILVGYHMQEFVVAGGEICAALTTQKPEIDNIRVLLMTTNFGSLFHSEITLSCDSMAVLEYGPETDRRTQSVAAGDTVTIQNGDSRLSEGRIVFRSANEGGMITVSSIERAQGVPVYPGQMEITEEDGSLLLLNEVDLEEYLKRVVPSEMPQSYELEALKAQAICARTYAWRQIQNNSYSQYGAHVDDSTNFQVYNNTSTYASTDSAVNETFGQMLTYEETPIEALYYSTSCGHGTDGSVWGGDAGATPYLRAVAINERGRTLDLTSNEAFGEFIKSMETEAYDSDFAMFRWNVTTTSEILGGKLDGVGRITGLTVTERGPGGVAKTLKVVGTEGTRTVSGQNRIRSVLGSASLTLNRKDGGTSTGWESLPSSFIYIENEGTDENQVTTFTIYGGGYGHGAGMSQNGAQGMAKLGKSCAEILRFFYQGCEIMDIGDVS